MNRAGWNPFRELEEMSDRLNRVVARVPRGSSDNEAMTMADWTPSVNISETTAEYVIEAEIPEVKKEDVRVTLENGVLTVRGMRRREEEEKGRKYHRVERSYGSFVRSFSLPDEVNDAQVQAVFKDGILTLHLPKSEKAKPKAVEVKVASS
jgi:HSP20 family protein